MITRTYRGVSIQASPAHQLSADIRVTFSHAVTAFSHLVALNETLTESEWRDRIRRAYQETPRIKRILDAITILMGTPVLARQELGPNGSPTTR
jgi:hypothetical protein